MKEKKVFIITDLGGGDGGKGSVVHKVCSLKNAHTVIKVGGAQGSHGVRTSLGQVHNFSQFGCGTFEGVRTHISDRMIIEPFRLLQEAGFLRYEWKIENIFDLLTIDENALCITPFHTLTSRLRELARKDKPKGTVGVGAGEAMLDSENHPELVIHVRDIGQKDFREKIEAVQNLKIKELSEITCAVDNLLSDDQEYAKEIIKLLNDPNFTELIVGHFNQLLKLANIVDSSYLKEKVLSRDGVAVVESSHGILTDRYFGFHPNVSRLRTVPMRTIDMLSEADYNGDIVHLGVTRAYQIRHGAGPMVTESPDYIEKLLPGSNKDENRWQGKVRVGPLDLVALRYAINVCGGPQAFDGLAITWFDQIKAVGRWDLCYAYDNAVDSDFFRPLGDIKVSKLPIAEQIKHQEKLGELLLACKPRLTSYEITPAATQEDIATMCWEVLNNHLQLPVRLISFGPTEKEKICR